LNAYHHNRLLLKVLLHELHKIYTKIQQMSDNINEYFKLFQQLSNIEI